MVVSSPLQSSSQSSEVWLIGESPINVRTGADSMEVVLWKRTGVSVQYDLIVHILEYSTNPVKLLDYIRDS